MPEHAWRHGQLYRDGVVYVWPTVRCAGCGRLLGTGSVAIDPENPPPPEPEPDWPFDIEDCPVCDHRFPRPDREARAIVRDLVAGSNVAKLQEIRRRARAWAAENGQDGDEGE